MTEKRSFEPTSDQENAAYLNCGIEIYKQLRIFCIEQKQDNDFILNTLCAALICLIKNHIKPEDEKQFLQLIHRILSKNL